ncbi:MAG: substrate-binding domain-containing protein [Phycisphaerae bacterium]
MILRYHDWPLPVSRLGRDADGVLTDASIDSQAMLSKLKCPGIYLTLNRGTQDKPTVTHDYQAAGQQAFQHLRDRGLRQMAVFTTGESYRLDASKTVEGFLQQARQTDIEPPVFLIGSRTRRRKRWVLDDQIADLADWLAEQPLPLGLMCIDDEHAWRAIEAARVAGLRVPEDVAVIGVGDDECLCESCNPTISSIALDYGQLGHDAASLLAAMLEHQPLPPPTPLPPLGVIERASTSVLAIDDPLVAEAVSLIRTETQDPPSIDHLAESLNVSRRTLYRRFINVLGRTPGEEIRRARLDAARRLVTNTDLKLAAIADRVGFPSLSQMSRDIQKEFGHRPTELRRRASGSRS